MARLEEPSHSSRAIVQRADPGLAEGNNRSAQVSGAISVAVALSTGECRRVRHKENASAVMECRSAALGSVREASAGRRRSLATGAPSVFAGSESPSATGVGNGRPDRIGEAPPDLAAEATDPSGMSHNGPTMTQEDATMIRRVPDRPPTTRSATWPATGGGFNDESGR